MYSVEKDQISNISEYHTVISKSNVASFNTLNDHGKALKIRTKKVSSNKLKKKPFFYYKVVLPPSNKLIFNSCVVGSPEDFNNGEIILLNDTYVLKVCSHNAIKSKSIGISNLIRSWIGPTGQYIKISSFGKLNIPRINIISFEIDYFTKNEAFKESISISSLKKKLFCVLSNQIISYNQVFLVEYEGHTIGITVNNLIINEEISEINFRKKGTKLENIVFGKFSDDTVINFEPKNDTQIVLEH